MGLVVGASGEEERVRRPVVRGSVAELQRPQSVDHQSPAGSGAQLPGRCERAAGPPPESVDPAVAEVADQQVAAEATEGARCTSDAPGRIQLAAASDPGEQPAVAVEGIDEAEPRPVDVVLAFRVLLSEGDEDAASNSLNPEGGEPAQELTVDERTRCAGSGSTRSAMAA